MRPSCYLNAVEIGDGNSLLYNGFSMCMDVVPSEIARRLVLPEAGNDFSFLTPSEQEYLLRRGHLTTLSPTSEREALRKLARAIAERDVESSGKPFRAGLITFVLTYQCNLSCAYCYQKEVRKASCLSPMSEGFVDEFFCNYLDKLLSCKRRENLNFTLYGGEPLLPGNRSAIERILHYSKKHGNPVSTVTNAVTLPEMLDLIGPEKGKINNVQVTLDGDQMFHNEKRISRSGGPTFDRTILALRELIRVKAHTIIRIHLHPDGVESARGLVEYLEGEKILGHDGIEVYFWSTEDFYRKVLSNREYELFTRLFQNVALKQSSPPTAHFAFLGQIMNMKTAGSRLVRKHCDICVTGLHCVVDSVGDIYECIDDAGRRDRRIATLADGEVEYFNRSEEYVKPHLHDRPECLQCSIALYCGGGCSNRLRTQADSQSEPFCLQIKEFVGLTLRSHVLLKQRNIASAN